MRQSLAHIHSQWANSSTSSPWRKLSTSPFSRGTPRTEPFRYISTRTTSPLKPQYSTSAVHPYSLPTCSSQSQPYSTSPPAHHRNPSVNPLPLSQKTVVISGASRGIGRAIAQRFANEGAKLILIGRDEVRLKTLRESLPFFDGGKEGHGGVEVEQALEGGKSEGERKGHRLIVGDVGERGFWEGLAREKNQIDHLVNAAGITHSSPFFSTSPALLEDVISTNLLGTMWAWSIINIASLLGLKGGRGSAAYAASKAGVIGLTRALASELGPSGIRVNVIVPGYISTDMTSAMTSQARHDALNAIPLNRFGEAEEIAHAAVFLATNKYASNCVLNLDGGLSAV